MSTESIRVVVVVGSARAGRLAPQVAQWFTGQAGQRGDLVTEVVDLVDHRLPDDLDATAPEVAALRPVLAAADAFVFVVPEYNRGIPGPLKTLIDHYNAEWEAKPVGFVTYGLSMAGGVRAVEHLRQVLGEFHCVGMKDIAIFPRILSHFDAAGAFAPEAAGCNEAAKVMLDQLVWWADALRAAKAKRPYRT
ncbi:NADPH-dependent FMN reductase [Actinacidiphila paucisporea]|uniref:NAD(P)H-dependent FMN reductase n=1 Tax=Actinacidiphila paucisporea TaxID=310782 RepID=A0A1M7QYD4_9ACTN|nr:NAD(P)H-dependent oxidoreductase [Actinacidiphila paucisporea]SHN37178.1 NAD(P)H-dependent FMN reductase [Actinacidiphila paucisporea]